MFRYEYIHLFVLSDPQKEASKTYLPETIYRVESTEWGIMLKAMSGVQ